MAIDKSSIKKIDELIEAAGQVPDIVESDLGRVSHQQSRSKAIAHLEHAKSELIMIVKTGGKPVS